MVVGPVEYIIVGFPGNKFNGRIAPELAKLIDSRLVRILDLIVISKDESGDVAVFEFDQLDELAPFADLDGDIGGILGQEDIDYAAASLAPNSTLGLLVWEDLWAAPFAAAVRDSGGVLLEGARVPHELAQEALSPGRASRVRRRTVDKTTTPQQIASRPGDQKCYEDAL